MSDTGTLQRLRPIVSTIVGDSRLVAVDIGARGDLIPQWLPLDGAADIIAVEPDADAARRLYETYQQRGHGERYRIVEAALSETGGSRTLYMPRNRGGSSLFAFEESVVSAYTDEDYLYPMDTAELATRAASEVFDELGEHRLDLIKLDIQGAELEVLRGLGHDRLKSLLFVELEAAMQPQHKSAPLFADIDRFLREQGFDLYDMRNSRVHRTKEGKRSNYLEGVLGVDIRSPSVAARIWEVDAVYARAPESVVDRGPAPLRALIVAFSLYNFFTEALHTIEVGERANVFSRADAEVLRQAVRDWHRVARYRARYKATGGWRLVRWVQRYLNMEERPGWWPHD